MELLVLGPLEARVDGHPVPLGAAKQRAVLAMLALHANTTVTADELMEGLWGEHPPASGPKMVQQYISQLRRRLAEDHGRASAIVTRGRGYELKIPPEDVDASRFMYLVERGAARQALALWRGGALDDIADEPFAAVEIRRLEELRLNALEQAVDHDLADGRHGELVGELEALVAEHPLSERLHGQLMLALYRSGRQAEALEAYRRARALLVDEVGIEPGSDLQRLHAAMLRQDASLDPPPRRRLPRELQFNSPMFGRTAELGRLRAAWHRTLDGTGSVILIRGSPGGGRTRLAAELAREVHEQGGPVLYGAAGSDASRRGSRPALLVLDQADVPPPEPSDTPTLCLVTHDGIPPAGAEQIRLGPLDEEAIAAIARLHGQEHDAARLARESGGLPGAAHRLAAEWARGQAERQVRTDALNTADERAELRRAESRLTGSVAELQSMRARSEQHEARRATVVCPYKGLAAFDRADADFFFGRERLVAETVARLVGSPLLGIVGASGSGKSSLMRAGLLSQVDDGVLPGSEGWTQAVLRPGRHPAAALRAATTGIEPGSRLLIAVDQFEEAFTQCEDPAERADFIGALVHAVSDPVRSAVVVLALRADFYDRCAEYPRFAQLLGTNQVLVGAMRRDELRRAIELPAERAGLQVEPELVEALLTDTAYEPGALPLLSTAMLELWQRRDGNRLRLADYEHTGGVPGAVARMAEAAYERLDAEQRRTARRMLLRLTGDEGVGAHVRRRVPLAELDAAGVLDVLADSRLVTISEGTAEVAHEALLQQWPRLRAWLEEDADGRRLHAQLTRATRDWSDERDRSELYRGARLAAALEWRAEHEPELNLTEQQFLDASRVASERARRRMQLVLAGVTALLIATAAAALIALDQRSRARVEAQTAEAQRLGAEALNVDALDLSLLLARQGVALDDTRSTELNLLTALRRSPAAVGAMRPGISGLFAIDLAGTRGPLAVSDLNGAVAFLDPATGRRLAVRRSSASAVAGPLASAADGTRLAATGADFQGGFIHLFDPRTQRHVAELRQGFAAAPVETAVFTPDSKELLVQAETFDDGVNRLWRLDARNGRLRRGEIPLPGEHSLLLGFARSWLVTYSRDDREVVLREPATLRAERRFAVPAAVVQLNAALGVVAFGGRDGSVRLLDLRTGRTRTADGAHDAPVIAVGFSRDGRAMVTADRDERVIVWDTRNSAAIETLQASGAGAIEDLALTPDGRTAYTAGRDGMVLEWDLEGSRRFERPLRVEGGRSLAGQQLTTSGRGERFAAIDRQGSIESFDGSTLHHAGRIQLAGGHRARAAAISPDGRTLAALDMAGRLVFWDARTLESLGTSVYAQANASSLVRFSGDGRWLVTGGFESIAHLWDARRRRLRNSVVFSGAADLSLNSQGTLLAATLADENFSGGLQVMTVPDLADVRRVPAPVGTLARFTPDGRSLLYGDREGRVWVYDTRTWKPGREPLFVTSPLRTAEISPDGRELATTSVDGTAGLWDIASGRAIGGGPPRGAGDLVGAGFIDGGRQLAVMHERGGYAWDLRPGSWARHACSVAGRSLTRAEWERALPGREYSPACAGR
jgi:DNA-binding SARP family transcriptional activator/WD40 repeat protein